jgi:predicted transposase/invertase (TIGR01784 family)
VGAGATRSADEDVGETVAVGVARERHGFPEARAILVTQRAPGGTSPQAVRGAQIKKHRARAASPFGVSGSADEHIGDKLTFIYLEMPRFLKTEEELETHFDKWLYVIKNLHRLEERPERIQERVFQRLFDVAEIARFTPVERREYEDSLKVYRDLKNVIDTSREEGRKEGREETLKKMARSMKAAGEPIDKMSEYTGFSPEQIADL